MAVHFFKTLFQEFDDLSFVQGVNRFRGGNNTPCQITAPLEQLIYSPMIDDERIKIVIRIEIEYFRSTINNHRPIRPPTAMDSGNPTRVFNGGNYCSDK